jgi:peptidoglycan/LPS O-acetylase OafA/YrhL
LLAPAESKITADPAFERLEQALAGRTIPGLNAVRAGAAVLVVITHFLKLPTGNLGVEIFFVLSGFLITTLLLKERERSGTVSLTAFYQRRARRILPAFYVFWAISAGIEWFRGHSLVMGQLTASLFYYLNYYQTLINTHSTFIRHCWSLAVEEQFYLLWPAVFLIFSKNLRRLAWIAFCVGLAFAVWRTAVLLIRKNEADWYTYNVFECRADQILWGCLLAVALNQRWFPRFFAALCSSPWWLVLTLSGLLISAALQPAGVARGTSGSLIEGALSVILLVQAMGLAEGLPPWRWLNSPLTAYGARISYPLYLYHWVPLTSGMLAGVGWRREAVMGISLSIVMAHLSYVLIKKRFLKSV